MLATRTPLRRSRRIRLHAAAPGNVLGRVPYLGFNSTGLSNTTTQGDSLYNSLQVQLRHQFSHGLLIQASYTWSKLITNINSPEAGGGIAAPGNVLSGGASSNDPLDFAQQYGLAAFNRPQRLIIAYSYDLPYHHTEGFSGKLLGGWTVSGVTTLQDGEPFTVIDGNGGTIFGARRIWRRRRPGRAEAGATGKCNQFGVCQGTGLATTGSHARPRSLTDWINRSLCLHTLMYRRHAESRRQPARPHAALVRVRCVPGADLGYPFVGAGTGFGNSAVGAIMGPGQKNWDISLIKHTKITEGLSTEFRAEFYNIWNHAQFNPPVNNVADMRHSGRFRTARCLRASCSLL